VVVMEINQTDKRYPELLKSVVGAPERLYIKGNVEVLKTPMVAVVGSRAMSRRGKMVCQKLVRGLCEQGKTIVSGLAIGIDGVAHETALKAKGKTVAVLAHGLQMIYPKEHQTLATRIVSSGGVLISEWEEGVEPKREYFVARNRIVVGMSQALFIVEADERSGSTSSATWAAEVGREVWAISGSAGCDLLISQGVNALHI